MHESSYKITGLDFQAVPKVAQAIHALPGVDAVSFNWNVCPPAVDIKSASDLGHEAVVEALQGTGASLQKERQ